jgi:phospho-N-acetylmuramoyl-pentapeptide-transferase
MILNLRRRDDCGVLVLVYEKDINVTIYGALVAFVVTAVLCHVLIPFLTRLKFGQNVREDGPEGHLKKSGTPTMGGIAIVIGFTVAALLFIKDSSVSGVPVFTYRSFEMAAVILATIGFGLLGFLDDCIKTVRKRSLGLTAAQKIIGQFLVTICFLAFFGSSLGKDAANQGFPLQYVFVPFMKDAIAIEFLYLPALVFVMMGGVNAVNLTDGLDGLCSGVTALVSVFLAYVAYIGVYEGERQFSLMPLPGAMLGSLLAFLLFNSHPARIFMGDTGSLLLGFVLSVSSIKFLQINGDPNFVSLYKINAPISMAVAVVIIPVFDTARIFLLRVSQGRSPFSPDKLHVHHLLMRMGLRHSQVALILGSLYLALVGFFFLLSQKLSDNFLIPIMAVTCVGLHFLLRYLVDVVFDRKRDKVQEKIVVSV